jgi:predicted phosphodiesterase
MKLAVLADIHGNWPALAAVAADIDAWRPDIVLVNGDIVNDGPNSPRCWDYIRRRRTDDGWLVLRGNHEDYVTEWRGLGTLPEGPAMDLVRLSRWTYDQLGGNVDDLAALPERWDHIAPDGSRLAVMHGTLLGNRVGIYPFTSDADVQRRIAPEATVFVTAHTHVPHIRELNGTQVINTGSVGIPGDGDGRAAYARIIWTRSRGWRPAIVRVEYDRTTAERDYFTSGFMAEAGPEAELSLIQFRQACDVRTRWAMQYRRRILAGELTLAESVSRFLADDEYLNRNSSLGDNPQLISG